MKARTLWACSCAVMEINIGKSGALLVLSATTAWADYATSATSYNPGTGYATEFGTGVGYTNATAALGEPSRVTPGAFGGPVDPYNPPYTRDQLVSIGAGGSLTVQFATPITHGANHAWGLDFTIYGDTGFSIVNGDYTGGGITDGSLFNPRTVSAMVSVSTDGNLFYRLNPSLAPSLGNYYPTDGTGNFGLPINPSLRSSSFANASLAQIRALYAGSAGGSSYSLDWAIDASGNPVSLGAIDYVRIDVLSGATQVDGFSTVTAAPEPGTVALATAGLVALLIGRRTPRI